MEWFRWQGSALQLQLMLQPGAKRDEFVGLHGDVLKVRVRAQAVEGRANRCLIEFLAEAFAAPRANVRLTRGDSARRKSLQIERPGRIPPALHALGLRAPSGDSRK
jgi:uncharacterized protein (TIGR00251 family)